MSLLVLLQSTEWLLRSASWWEWKQLNFTPVSMAPQRDNQCALHLCLQLCEWRRDWAQQITPDRKWMLWNGCSRKCNHGNYWGRSSFTLRGWFSPVTVCGEWFLSAHEKCIDGSLLGTMGFWWQIDTPLKATLIIEWKSSCWSPNTSFYWRGGH